MTDSKFDEVLFIMLSEANIDDSYSISHVMERKWDRFREGYFKFFTEMAFHTKCHIKFDAGEDYGRNIHAHFVVLVQNDELWRFNSRLPSFKPSSRWKYRTLDIRRWKDGFNTYGYVRNSHRWVGTLTACPKYYNRCRNGRCDNLIRRIA